MDGYIQNLCSYCKKEPRALKLYIEKIAVKRRAAVAA
jgi:hypothetical protein